MSARPKIAVAVAALLAAGCGSIDNPDLATGTVTGRISDASPGAFAYVLGVPGVHAPIASNGSFRLDRVPKGQRKIVLFDGSVNAGMVDVEVEGATIANLPDPGSLLPACAILVAAALGGAQPTDLSFSVDGALLRGADGTPALSVPGPAALLFPLPEGSWTLRAGQPGYLESVKVAYNLAGGQSWPVDLSLDVESTSDRRGCVSSGCEYSLACEPGDGRCYECTSAADCKASEASCVDHVCVNPPPADGLAMCQACNAVTDCGPGPGGEAPACVVAAPATVGYCSYDCGSSPAGYPSGYRCDGVPTGVAGNPSKAWLAPVSCLALYTTYGSSCATDDACKVALDGGKCWRPADAPPDSTVGVCSARCPANADCPPWLADWTCDTTGTRACQPPP